MTTPKAGDTIKQINDLRSRRNAVILAHNYQPGEIQEVADFVGDSLELSLKVRDVRAEWIIFCGVRFMAETAAILCPDQRVVLPNPDAGCPMADMADGESVRAWRQEHPGAIAVCYVNTTAEVKAECDLCCTSANAVEIVSMLPSDREILFLPDRNLGRYVEQHTGRALVLWPGFCPSHQRMTPEHIRASRAAHPEAHLMVHPECPPEVTALADSVRSTGGMVRVAKESGSTEFLLGTEPGMAFRLQRDNPGKRFHPVTNDAICSNMKKITLEHIANSLETGETRIEIAEPLRTRALRPILNMIERRVEL
jgi:quinolinate synthase